MTVRRAMEQHGRILLFVWLVLSLAINILMLTGPAYMLQIYNRVLPSSSHETLVVISALMVALFVGLGVLDLVRARVLARVARRVEATLREHLLSLSTQVIANTGNMPQARRPHADLEAVTNFIGGPAITAFFDTPFVPFYILIIWLFHPYLALFALFSTLLLAVMAYANARQLRQPQEEAAQRHAMVAGMLHELLAATEAMKTLGMTRFLRRRWLDAHDEHLTTQLKLRDRSLGFGAMAKAVRLLLQSGMLGLGAWLVLQQEIHAGTMIAASIMLGRALHPAEQAITHWRSFRQARTAQLRLDAELEALTSLPASPDLAPETDCEGRLEARELFAAPPALTRPVVRNINFTLQPGQLLLVTGGNGHGKSTLARVLAGLWIPLGTGKVLLDDVDLRGWPEEARGRNIGYLPQEPQLMSGSIGENIARFSEAATEEEILAATRRIGVHEAIKRMGGINRQVGPGGHLLSAGERRKVALARAAFGDPVVYILDEPTADLDQQGRAALHDALAALKARGRSIVLVEHGTIPPELVDLHLHLDSEGNGRLRPVAASSGAQSGGQPVRAGYSITLARQ